MPIKILIDKKIEFFIYFKEEKLKFKNHLVNFEQNFINKYIHSLTAHSHWNKMVDMVDQYMHSVKRIVILQMRHSLYHTLKILSGYLVKNLYFF